MKTISLNGAWKGLGLSPKKETIAFEGQVPGCVHTDLLRAKKIPEPFWRYNAEECQWIENWSWQYEKAFTVDEVRGDEQLIFEGLDVYAEVYLNGARVGEADNMFIPHAFPAGARLRPGENQLKVILYSPIARTNGKPERHAAFSYERLYTRRLQCTYYWDWVNRFVTCGIFKDVKLCLPGPADIQSAYVYTRHVDAFGAQIGLDVEMDVREGGAHLNMELTAPDGKVLFSKRRLIVEKALYETVDIPSPALWWPNGMGEQPLYTFTLGVEREGAITHARTVSFGVRTVRILQLPDEPGSASYEKCLQLKEGPHVSGENAFWDRNQPEDFSGFILLINETPVFCKGANWVPSEPFPSAETPEKIGNLLALSKQAGMNMIRVWGGGLFEQDFFYEECDRLGLMVTQDFLMACGNYPEEEDWFLDQLRAEAEHAAKRLRNHPSLVWWTGDNENAMGGDENMPDYMGRRSALRAIGPVLRALDPWRDFLPSSPFGGTPNGSITKGTAHNTNYIGELFSYIRFSDFGDYAEYFDKYLCRFCPEEPIMGAPMTASLRKFMSEEDIFGDDDEIWRYHTKNNPSEAFREFEIFDYLKAIAEKLLGAFQSGEDRVFKLQYVQYEWARITLELFRREKWFSAGIVYWMLNDCWPASGWALIDYYQLPKAGWYGFKRAAKQVASAISKQGGQYRVHAMSEDPRARKGEATLFVQPFEGEKIVLQRAAFELSANACEIVLTEEADRVAPLLDGRAILMCEIESESERDRTFHFEKRPCDLAFPEAQLRCARNPDGSVTVSADRYVHAVGLDGACVFSDNYFPLLPGESRTISVSASCPVEIRYLGMAGKSLLV